MRCALAAIAILASTVMSGCSSEPHGPCVKSHTEYVPPTYVKSGNVMIPVGGGPVTVCDKYAPVESEES